MKCLYCASAVVLVDAINRASSLPSEFEIKPRRDVFKCTSGSVSPETGIRHHPLRQCIQILDSKHPGCAIRQIVAGPITDNPIAAAVTHGANLRDDLRASRNASKVFSDTNGGRFSCRWNHDDSSGSFTAQDGSQPNMAASSNTKVDAMASTDSSGAGIPTTPKSMATANPSHQPKLAGGKTEGGASAAPGWDDTGASTNRSGSDARQASPHPDGSRPSSSTAAAVATITADNTPAVRRRQWRPVSAGGDRSFLEAFLDGGHSPATAIAAGLDPATSARGVAASVVAEAVTIAFVGAAVVLGPVVGRVTQSTAVVLLEVGSTATVGCVLTDGVTGGQHKQVIGSRPLRMSGLGGVWCCRHVVRSVCR